jgi:hypothetical protein
VVAGGDGAEVLEPTVGAFDNVAPFVALGIKREEPLAIGLVGDHGRGAAAVEEGAQMIGVIALVCDQPSACCRRGQERRGGGDIGDIAAAQEENDRSSLAVDEGVDLGRAAATRAADRLATLPPLWNGPPLSSTMSG